MTELRVHWRRTWQVKPYESETIELGMTDTVPLTGTTPEARGKEAAQLEARLLTQLATMGDKLMAQRLSAPVG